MILFQDLLAGGDLSVSARKLAGDFKQRFALPEVHQLGLVVPDVEDAARELEAKGIGPFFIAGGSPDFWYERGEPRKFTGKMGLAVCDGLEIELLEPGTGSDFYAQSVDKEGRPVVQHLGFLVSDVDIWASVLAQAGYPVWVKGRLSAWPTSTRFAYMDTVRDAGLVIEFISWRLLGLPFRPLPGLYHTLGRIQKFTGKRTIYL
ncbi:MAG: VOC family protein [Desulfomonilia bacterium]|jgi:hypothetical protein|uniref:VOC domain-containing protein n=1 Tax=anaerobic digester metagenome TaxID=1263854 RepID=A0A485M705_9ZZZZ|nr:VOC family protein [Pseudomonadota bacterium]HON39118.1 VOC family protein [Deltaproteobacteria bacterium]HRS56136.1 VOC family protein [Desulfomonilia bacterium]HPD21187.1 VOC family protein [Deltaproteobacteria bacterium]HPX18154.1 VOC family protein [Deltaproteobacteria bacterium]